MPSLSNNLTAPSTESLSSESPSFESLGVPAPLVRCLTEQSITAPFPIQAATLPDSLGGRDVLGRGRTGSGKTIAFALPIVARLANSKARTTSAHPRALVLVPTRELATQVQSTLAPLAHAVNLSVTTIFGGVSQQRQVASLKRGVDIVVACPGRLEDLIRQRHINLDRIEICVLDEADHMADLGFLPGVKRILDQTPRRGQRLLFSATLDHGVDVLVRRYLNDPVTHAVDDEPDSAPDIEHHVFTVAAGDKPTIVRELASGQDRSVLFLRTKHSAKKLARDLTAAGIPAVDLHGNLSQTARDRNLDAFRAGRVRVLVATDIAARGIHVDDIALVVHVDPPAEHKAYLHRSGRTARAGSSGIVVTVQTDAQRAEVNTLTKRAGIRPTVVRVIPGAPEIVALAGPKAEYVTPVALDRPQTSSGTKARAARPGRSRRSQSQGRR